MRRHGRCSPCGPGWISGLSRGPGPHRGQPEDRARDAKWKQIAEKLEQSHGAVNIKLLQLE